MVKKGLKVLPILCVSVFLIATQVKAAQEFSADMVSRLGNKTTTTKMYVADDKVRMEMPQGAIIVRRDKNVTWILMPSDKMYMENPIDESKAPKLSKELE